MGRIIPPMYSGSAPWSPSSQLDVPGIAEHLPCEASWLNAQITSAGSFQQEHAAASFFNKLFADIRTPHPIPQVQPRHPAGKTHFGCLFPWSPSNLGVFYLTQSPLAVFLIGPLLLCVASSLFSCAQVELHQDTIPSIACLQVPLPGIEPGSLWWARICPTQNLGDLIRQMEILAVYIDILCTIYGSYTMVFGQWTAIQEGTAAAGVSYRVLK